MLTDAQIIETQQAALIASFDLTRTLTNALFPAQEVFLLDDLAEFALVKYKYSDLNGRIAGFVTDNAAKRLAIRNDIRRTLGLPMLLNESGAITYGNPGGGSFTSTLPYF